MAKRLARHAIRNSRSASIAPSWRARTRFACCPSRGVVDDDHRRAAKSRPRLIAIRNCAHTKSCVPTPRRIAITITTTTTTGVRSACKCKQCAVHQLRGRPHRARAILGDARTIAHQAAPIAGTQERWAAGRLLRRDASARRTPQTLQTCRAQQMRLRRHAVQV